MKPGITTLTHTKHGFPPTVEVGGDDGAVHVSFGTLTLTLSNANGTITVTGRAYDYYGHRIPTGMHVDTDAEPPKVSFTVEIPTDGDDTDDE